MSNGKPRYEHAVKWTEIVPMLTSGDPEKINEATALLMVKDRDLEDNWPIPGMGGISKSWTSVNETSFEIDHVNGSEGTSRDVTFDQPTDVIIIAESDVYTTNATQIGSGIRLTSYHESSHGGPPSNWSPSGLSADNPYDAGTRIHLVNHWCCRFYNAGTYHFFTDLYPDYPGPQRYQHVWSRLTLMQVEFQDLSGVHEH